MIDPRLFVFWLRWQTNRADRPCWWTWRRMMQMTEEVTWNYQANWYIN